MSMSKKDYIKLAEVVREFPFVFPGSGELERDVFSLRCNLAKAIGEVLDEDNPMFSWEKWIKAAAPDCGCRVPQK